MTKLFAALLLTLLAVAAPTPAFAIAHGQDAPDGDYPFSVRLTMTGIPTADHGSRDSWCSGALVAPRWVITAGHCFRDADDRRVSHPVAGRTTATVGRADLTRPAGHVVDVVAVHQSDTADVALAELATPVTDVTPLRVATDPPRPGELVRLTGYGQTSAASDRPTRLQTGRFVVDRVDQWTVDVSGRSPRQDTSACPHDSGGPYFREDPAGTPELIGVVSTGPTCPHEGADVSARTDNLTGWITATTADRPALLARWPALVTAGAVALAALLLTYLYLSTARKRQPASWPREGRVP